MRKLTKLEEALLEKIVSIYINSSADSIPELQVTNLLRNELDFFAIKWKTNPKPQITIYKPKNGKLSDSEIDNIYFQIANFIYFLEELEDVKFIKLQRVPTENQEDYTIFYDCDKYSYDSEADIFLQNMPNINLQGNAYEVRAIVSLEGWKTFHTDFAIDLEKYGKAIIYPLPLLVDFVDNNFKTIEQRRFETQKKLTSISIWVAIAIGILSLIITQCVSNKEEQEKVERIETAINHTKLIISDCEFQTPHSTFITQQGLNLDTVWDNIVISIRDIQVEDGKTVAEQITADDQRAKILAQIANLKHKMAIEKQPCRKREYYSIIVKLKKLL